MLLTIFLALAPRAALAVTCDACGESATYTETLSWMNGYRRRRIAAAGCPNHYSYPPPPSESDGGRFMPSM